VLGHNASKTNIGKEKIQVKTGGKKAIKRFLEFYALRQTERDGKHPDVHAARKRSLFQRGEKAKKS